MPGPHRPHLASASSWTVPAVLGGLLLFCAPAFGQLLWSEEFEGAGAPDDSTWSYDLGASGWGNQELQEYTDALENVRVEDGQLVITVREQGGLFTSGRIRTQDKVIFKYGTIEARISFPDLANGLWPAFWTLGNNFSQVGWPSSGEMDVVEMGSAAAIAAGVVNRRVGSTAHWERNDSHTFYGRTFTASADLAGEFQVFRMDWTPGSLTTFLNGVPVWTMDISDQGCFDCEEFHEPHFIILNMAVGGTYTQIFNTGGITAPTPAEMRVDWIRIYDNGFTEMGGSGLGARIGVGHSGSWFNPDQSGHGFSIEIGELNGEPFAVVYWYTYDAVGNPMFLVGSGAPVGDVLEVTFESPYGMAFGVFDPASVIRAEGGTGRFEFSDPDNASFSYTPSDFNTNTRGHVAVDSMPLVKLFDIGEN